MQVGVQKRIDNVKTGRARPKLTWDESVRRDLKEWNISKEVASDRSAWRLHYQKSLECRVSKSLPCAFCRAHGKELFCRVPR